MRHPAIVLACILVIFAEVPRQPAPRRVFEGVAGAISEFRIGLQPNQTVTFETVNLSDGADPVLHLLDLRTGRELASDDNGAGGRAARLTYTSTAASPIPGLLVVRPRAVWSKGTCDISRNGAPWEAGARLEGWMQPLLDLRTQESIVVVPTAGGPPAHQLYILSDDGLHIELRAGAGMRTRWAVPPGFDTFRTFMVGVDPRTPVGGVRILVNDASIPGSDPDGDGLGRELERQLMTCSAANDLVGAFECSTAADLRDTDGDGISDGWEVLGRDWKSPQGQIVHVPLPYIGADPRHKDLFVEVDYRRLTKAENDAGGERRMTPAVARAIAALYGDAKTTFPLIRAFHGRLLGNPDLEPGIRVHLDTGVYPEMEADRGVYGSWGGYNTVNAMQLANGSWEGQPPGPLWRTHMHPSRHGIFKYGPAHATGGGQCDTGVACGIPMGAASTAAHELGHSFGLLHGGPDGSPGLKANCAPNYSSLMNYAYQGTAGFSDGQNRRPLNNASLKEWRAVDPANKGYLADLTTTFRYKVDLINGHVDWNSDGRFAPEGESVRAYANFAPNENCEFSRMNEYELAGARTNSSLALTRFQNGTYVFFVSPEGKVQYVRSVSNWTCAPAEKDCPGSSFSQPGDAGFNFVATGVDAEATVLNGRPILAVVASGRNGSLWSRFAVPGPFGLTWAAAEQITATPVSGEPSLAGIRLGSGLYLAYKGSDNIVRWRNHNGVAWDLEHTAQTPQGPLTTSVDASPAIVHAYLPWKSPDQPMLYAVVAGPQGLPALYWLDFGGQWINTQLLEDPGRLTPTVGRPAMAWVPDSSSADFPGILYLAMRVGTNGVYWISRSYHGADGQQKVGRSAFFDNMWFKGAAIDLTTGTTGAFPQLWAAPEFARNNSILFRPRADGILDFAYRNWDDWTALRWGLCRYVVNPTGQESNPIRCMERPY